jgi:hypothetical protein
MIAFMRKRFPKTLIWASLLAFTLAGCHFQTNLDAVQNSAAPPAAIRTPTATTIPEPGVIISDLTLQRVSPSKWQVLGLAENVGDENLGLITIRTALRDGKGQILAEHDVPAALAHLAPGERSPFIAEFSSTDKPDSAYAEPIKQPEATFQRIPITFDNFHPLYQSLSDALVLAYAKNLSHQPAILGNAILLQLAPDGSPIRFSRHYDGLSYLSPDKNLPFLFHFDSIVDEGQFKVFADAIAVNAPEDPSVALCQQPRLLADAQGNPFILGVIENQGSETRWANLLLILRANEETLTIMIVRPPIPLNAGARLAFTVTDFPGCETSLLQDLIEEDKLILEVLIDPLASHPTQINAIQLDLQINSYEFNGSNLFIKGRITNSTEHSISQPSFLAAIRSIDGALQSAGWISPAEALAPGESSTFLLPLPVPKNINPSMCEYDFRALGLVSEIAQPE